LADLYVANDFGADELYFNTGATETPPRFAPFVGQEGHPAIGDDWWKGMNVDFGDVDGNGFLDIYVTNILAPRYKTDEGNMLWLNLPDPRAKHGRRFVNVGKKTGTHDGGWGWERSSPTSTTMAGSTSGSERLRHRPDPKRRTGTTCRRW
jgi:hypothetical protein